MVTRNDITGDAIQTRQITDSYRENFDRIFGKKKKDDKPTTTEPTTVQETPTPADTEPKS